MNPKQATNGWAEEKPTALLVLADGTVLEGHGLGGWFGNPWFRMRSVSGRSATS